MPASRASLASFSIPRIFMFPLDRNEFPDFLFFIVSILCFYLLWSIRWPHLEHPRHPFRSERIWMLAMKMMMSVIQSCTVAVKVFEREGEGKWLKNPRDSFSDALKVLGFLERAYWLADGGATATASASTPSQIPPPRGVDGICGCRRCSPRRASPASPTSPASIVPTLHLVYLVLLSFTLVYLVLPSFTEFYRVLPSFTEFYRVLLGFAEFYQVLPMKKEF